jgi:hypothetical protein
MKKQFSYLEVIKGELSSYVTPDVLEKFRIKCEFYDLDIRSVIGYLIILFSEGNELDHYFNITEEDSIFFKHRGIENHNNLKKRIY